MELLLLRSTTEIIQQNSKINCQNQINEITDSYPHIWDPSNIQDCGTLFEK